MKLRKKEWRIYCEKVIALLLVISMMIVPIGAVDTYAEDTVVGNVSITEDDIEEFQAFVDEMKQRDPEICRDDFQISTVKVVLDFAGNMYYDIECTPTGYFIYCPAAGEFVEFSYYGISPYADCEGDLFYAGPMEYYVDEEDTYCNLLTNEKIEDDDVESYAQACEDAFTQVCLDAAGSEAEVVTCDDGLSTYASASDVLVGGANFFTNLKTEKEVGYFSGNYCGYCGYIAAGMLLLYYDCYLCDSVIDDDVYNLSADGKAFNGYGFSKGLYTKYGKNNSTSAFDFGKLQGIDDVIDDYIDTETYCSISKEACMNTDVNVATTILNTKRPVIVFGRVYRYTDDTKVDHAIIAYGAASDGSYLITHFGYGSERNDYSKVYVSKSQIMVGSTYRITDLNGVDSASVFSDIDFYWARKDINRCVEHDVLNGMTDTTFEPKGYITRGMLVTILYRLAGKPSCSISHPFTDVSSTRYYAKPISWAYQNGIANGTSSTEFSPNEYITRTQAVRMIYRYATIYDNYSLPTTSFNQSDYPEYSSMSGETKTAWNWAIRTETIKGDLTNEYYYLRPNDNIQRAEMAAIINRIQSCSGRW